MYIYFLEQVWSNENHYWRWNATTDEIQRRYWDQWNYQHRGSCYPTKYMEEGVDYYDY